MFPAFFLFSISVLLFSCQKQKQVSIVGGWLEISVYQENAGQLSWGEATKFPLRLWLDANGKYAAFNDVPAGRGNYSYDHSTGRLKFETLNALGPETYSVSYLDDNYLIIDYSPEYKIKFVRL